MSRYIGYLVLLISLYASGVVSVSVECEEPECPAFESIMLPVPDDCTKFIYCDNGVKIVETCQEGLHFNPILFICDWPASAGCVLCVEPTTTEVPTTEAPTTTEVPTTEAPTTTEVPTTEAPTTTEVPTTEAPTTTEVPTTEAPTTTKAPTTTEVPTTQEPTTEEPTTQEPTTQDPTTQEPTTIAPEVCEIADCPYLEQNLYVFLRVPWNCGKYVMCLNDHVYEMFCSSGLIFDELVQNCVIPQEDDECVECEIAETTLEPEITTEQPCEIEECLDTQETPLYLAVPWDCSKLILCIRGQTFEQTCGTGLHFSPVEQTCVLPENTVCEVCEPIQLTTESDVTTEVTTESQY